jgi:hypothetical protein
MTTTMRLKMILVMALVMVPLWAAPAAGQVRDGLSEIGVEGSFDRGNAEFGARMTTINFDGSYGFFVTKRLEIGPAFSFAKTPSEDARSGISGFVDFHFGDTAGQAVPYVEAAYGQTFGDDEFAMDPTFASAGAGVKWFFGHGGGALNLSGFYRRTFFDVGGAPNFATGINALGAKVGVAVYFGR